MCLVMELGRTEVGGCLGGKVECAGAVAVASEGEEEAGCL